MLTALNSIGRSKRLSSKCVPSRGAVTRVALSTAVSKGPPFLERIATMLMTIAVVLLVLWALGMVSAYTIGGFIHILLVVAVVMILVRVIQGRRPIT